MKKAIEIINKFLEYKFIRFLIVGGINTVVGYGLFALFLYLEMHYYLAYVLSFILGVTNSYVWNKLFTFKSRNKSYKEILRFISVYLVSFAVGSIVLYLIVDIMNINEYLAGFINLIFTTLISWIGHKRFSFRD